MVSFAVFVCVILFVLEGGSMGEISMLSLQKAENGPTKRLWPNGMRVVKK